MPQRYLIYADPSSGELRAAVELSSCPAVYPSVQEVVPGGCGLGVRLSEQGVLGISGVQYGGVGCRWRVASLDVLLVSVPGGVFDLFQDGGGI